ncbi:hypothetical protein IDJ77_11625 [Mucilaginibacter sp. ZT4R22]|uniref:Uncharacterized protein n=1 Tax=Mucilaginibacter pankratovii TaxID=2772110 RepID=A0ABR7WSU0_9SPHI|nr:hypothetical protein [Mucilaginibacter pankratovii]MBD1364459.1 hypothetical protein [Mucilaginibacter pankratovii]
MKKYKVLVMVILGIVVLFLFFTNPTTEDFKKECPYYSPRQKDTTFGNYVDPHFIVRRERNYFLFSRFTWSNLEIVGIAGNFFVAKIIPGQHKVISDGITIYDGFYPSEAEKNK